MKTQDLREMDQVHLTNRLGKLRSEHLSLLEDIRSGKEKNYSQLAGMRRGIARVQTILGEKLHSS